MMKLNLIMMSALMIGALAAASSAPDKSHSEVFEVYLFIGGFSDMAKTLEEKLAEKILENCGDSDFVKMSSLHLRFESGLWGGKKPLEAGILKNELTFFVDPPEAPKANLSLYFPGHPKAILEASYDCK